MGQPQTNCLTAMDFAPKVLVNLRAVNMAHLRSLEQGHDILALHPRSDGGPPPHKRPREGEEPNTDSTMDKPARMGFREQSVAGFKELESSLSDGLVMVCKQHPSALLIHLMRNLAEIPPGVTRADTPN